MHDDGTGTSSQFPRPKAADARADGDGAGGRDPGPQAASERLEPEPAGAADDHEYAKPLLTLKRRSAFVRKAMLALPRWVTPNGVTIFRTLLIVPIAWLLREGHYWAALFVLGFSMLLDFVDGALAEARNQKTPLGAFLDPLSDKIVVCGTLLAVMGRLPRPFSLAIGLTCVFAAVNTMVRLVKMARSRRGLGEPTIAAKPAGKLKLVAETATMLLVIIGLAVPSAPVIWAGGAMFLVALWYAAGSAKAQLLG